MLLERADADTEVAKLLIEKTIIGGNDEIMLDYAAYHIQQGIEKSLKYIL